MVRSIKLKFGRTPGFGAETIVTTPVTVFVGPNNSGKSRILTEISRFCGHGESNISDVIVDEVEFQPLSEEVAEQRIQGILLKPRTGETVAPHYVIVGKRGNRLQLDKAGLMRALMNPNAKKQEFSEWFLSYNTLNLDGKSRIDLVRDQTISELIQPPQTSLQVLFRDDSRRSELRRIIHEALGVYFVIDPTHLGHLRIRLSQRAPEANSEERRLDEAAVAFHEQALPIAEASDGVKAFTGLMTEIVAGDPSILLIDEPEAFLHPSLSSKLGKEISAAVSGSEKRLFVSTHSASFVMGCIQSGAPVTIVRLTYRDAVATARVLPNSELLRLMRNPLLRSTGILEGLFYEFVIVTESDADRAFYQEVNERLLLLKSDWGIPNCLFVNAQNWQTVGAILKPLRELGIPAAGIVDVDILKGSGAAWPNLLSSGSIPQATQAGLSPLRAAIRASLDATGKDMKTEGGINVLDPANREAANGLLDQLADYGLFVVRGGELESWLKKLQVAGHGPSWLIEIFEKMGEDPDSSAYLTPDEDDVWLFISQVKKWLINPDRKGIPREPLAASTRPDRVERRS